MRVYNTDARDSDPRCRGRKQGRPKKRWMGAARGDTREAGVEEEDTGDQEKWKARTCCGDPE